MKRVPDKVNRKMLALTQQCLPHAPIIADLTQRFKKQKPFSGLRVAYSAHLTVSSLLQINALIAGGANITVIENSALAMAPDVLEYLRISKVPVCTLDELRGQYFDLALDCCAQLLSVISPKYGVAELTRSGVKAYEQANVSYPVISIDDAQVKKLETLYGTADGFLRAFRFLTSEVLTHKKVVLFGFGKVGRGIAFSLSKFQGLQLTIVESDPEKQQEAAQAGFHALSVQNFYPLKKAWQDTFLIITATGEIGMMSNFFEYADVPNCYWVNMGAEDEWGPKFPKEEVLNQKVAINFILEEPTKIHYLDPVFAAQNQALEELLVKKYSPGIHVLSAEVDLEILSAWTLFHAGSHHQEEQFQAILEHIPCYVYWKDKDLVYQGCNKNFAKAAGKELPEDLIGKTDFNLPWLPSEADIYRRHDAEVMLGNSLINFEETQLQADNTQRVVLASKVPYRDIYGRTVGVVGIYTDITKQKESEYLRLENERHKAELILQERLAKLSAQVAHDIRSPLAALTSCVRSLQDNLPESERILMRSAISRIQDIANNLIDQYQNQKSDDLSKEAPVIVLLVFTLLESIVSEKRRQFEQYPIAITLDAQESALFSFVKLDPTAFKRSISNLINNSVDALEGRPNAQIWVKLITRADTVKILVIDNGKGIPKDLLPAVVATGASFKENGLGLGLSYAKHHAQSCGGKLFIGSTEGQGTQVTMILPSHAAPVWFVSAIMIKPNLPIVVAEDDEATLSFWKSRLQGFQGPNQPIFFSKAAQFLEWYRAQQSPAIQLFTDYEFLGENLTGLSLLEELSHKQGSVLVTSYYEKAELIQRCVKLGVGLLPKNLLPYIEFRAEDAEFVHRPQFFKRRPRPYKKKLKTPI